jgi:hypothetical protein
MAPAGVIREMPLWIPLVVGAFVVVAYLAVMRVLFHRSQELDKQVDPTKIRPWKDEED